MLGFLRKAAIIRVAVAALWFVALCLPVTAQPLPGYFNPLVMSSVDEAGTITFTDDSTQNSVSTTHTYASQSFGSAFSGRIIVVVAAMQSNSTAITSATMTIGGIAATQAIFLNHSNLKAVAIFAASVPTGTTGTVAVTTNQNMFGSAIAVYNLANVTSVTATDTGSNQADPAIVPLDVSAGGVAVGVVMDVSAGTYTWTNLSENADATFGSGVNWSAASAAFASTQTNLSIETDASAPSAELPIMVAASFR